MKCKDNLCELKSSIGHIDTMRFAMHLIKNEFIILNEDNITDGFAIGVKDVKNSQYFGIVNVEGGLVKGIIEMPEKLMSNLINADVFRCEMVKYIV